jgi:TonB family protein
MRPHLKKQLFNLGSYQFLRLVSILSLILLSIYGGYQRVLAKNTFELLRESFNPPPKDQSTFKQVDTIDAQIPHAEDYESTVYIDQMSRKLAGRLSAAAKASDNWAVASFVIEKSGKISKAKISDSTGNAAFNNEVLNIFKNLKLAKLEEDSPPRVKALYAFNHTNVFEKEFEHQKQTKQIEEEEGAESKGISANSIKTGYTSKTILDGLMSNAKTGIGHGQKKDAAEMILSGFVGSLVGIYFMVLVSSVSKVFISFLLAGVYWWAHRLFLGRFPC